MSTITPMIELLRMTPKELRHELARKRIEAQKTRLALSLGSEKNHAKYRGMRKEIARMFTALTSLEKNRGAGIQNLGIAEKTPEKTSQKEKTPVKKLALKKKSPNS